VPGVIDGKRHSCFISTEYQGRMSLVVMSMVSIIWKNKDSKLLSPSLPPPFAEGNRVVTVSSVSDLN
jgi:hypothetical protein